MALQAEGLGHLDAKLGHVKFQLQLVKATHATVELNKLRAPVAAVEPLPAVAMLDRPVVKDPPPSLLLSGASAALAARGISTAPGHPTVARPFFVFPFSPVLAYAFFAGVFVRLGACVSVPPDIR
jgi:hypothetical protein